MQVRLNRWFIYWLAIMLSLAGMVVAGSLGLRIEHRMHDLRSNVPKPKPDAVSAASTISGASTLGAVASKDFTHALPARVDVQPVLATIHAACESGGVELRGVQSQSRVATTQTLGLTTLSLHLQGSYPAIKQVLIDISRRHEFITVQSLSIRAVVAPGASSASNEAWATLSLWTRPAGAAVDT